MQRDLVWKAGIGLVMLATALSVSSGGATAPDGDAVEAILAGMTDTGSGISSGRLLLSSTSTSFGSDGEPSGETVTEQEVWFDSVRVRVEVRPSRGEKTLWVFDGERVVETSPPEFAQALVGYPPTVADLDPYGIRTVANTLIHWTLQSAIYHTPPLASELPGWSSEPLRLAAQETVAGLSCRVLEVPAVSTDCGQSVVQRLWVAPDRAYAVARFEQDVALPDSSEASRIVIVDEVSEWLQPVAQTWIPKKVLRTVRRYGRGNDQARIVRTEESEVLAADLNGSIPDSVFELVLPETTEIVAWE